MKSFLATPLRAGFTSVVVAGALIVLLLSPLSPLSETPTASAFSLSPPSDVPNNAGQTLSINNEAVSLTFVSVSAGFNNEFGRILPSPAFYFICKNIPVGFTVDGGRFGATAWEELRFYLTTPPQGSPSLPRTFVTGPGANNPDGFAHARMTQIASDTVRLEWEDLLNGGDQDFNDCVVDIVITPLAKLTICKDVIGDDGGATAWDFVIDGPDPESDRNLNGLIDGGCQTEALLSAGQYVVTETTQPAGYDTSAACDNGASSNNNVVILTLSGGDEVTCTFTNETTAQFQVQKDFVPDDPSDVTIVLTCDSGTVIVIDDTASESDPADFDVEGFGPGTECTATEGTPPLGYEANESDCQDVPISPGSAPICTIVNSTVTTFTVNKDFVPDDPSDVTVLLICTDGSVTIIDAAASEADPAEFKVLGFLAGTTCDATENPVPAGHYPDYTDCTARTVTAGGSTACTITNRQFAELTVCKEVFLPDASSFQIDVIGPTPHGGVFVHGQCETYDDLESGSYTLQETTLAGYRAAIDCGPKGSVDPGASLAFNIDPGETISCTVTNTFTPSGPVVGGIVGLLDPDDAPPALESSGNVNRTLLIYIALSFAIVGAIGIGGTLAWRRVRSE